MKITLQNYRRILRPLLIRKNSCFYYLFLFCYCGTYGQKVTSSGDSTYTKSFEYYAEKFFDNTDNNHLATVYAAAWLTKAKKEKNIEEELEAYKAFSHLSTGQLRLKYADSMVITAKRTNSNLLLGSAYLSRGIVYYENRQHSRALDDYLVADRHISKSDDRYLAHKLKYQIGFTKYYLGHYHEAVSLLRQCTAYFKDEHPKAYLNSLHALGLCYNSIKQYSLSSQTNRTGIAAAKEQGLPEMIPYFLLSEGINNFGKHNYKISLKLINESLPHLKQVNDMPNQTLAAFYIAKCYWKIGNFHIALPYLLKVDSSFTAQNYLRPDLLENYVLLKDYYKKRKDDKAQLFYIDRLLKADSIAKSENKYLSDKISSVYNRNEIIKEKEQIKANAQVKIALSITMIFVLLVVVSILLVRHIKNKKRLKHFEHLFNEDLSKPQQRISNSYLTSDLDLNPEVAATLLQKLQKFEKNQKFLEKDMTLVKLATILNTNQKYVTKIIAHYRGKKTIEYISDLKIDYILEKLKKDRRYRNYTNKALGDEAGFGSTQIFTKTFKSRTGMSPTWFITELNKKEEAPVVQD